MPKLTALSLAPLLALLFAAGSAFAFDREELQEARGVLAAQLHRIDAFGGASCPEEYAKFYAGKSLRISLFYGYENYDDITADRLHAQAVADTLRKKCTGNIQACGFTVASRAWNKVELERTINGFPVRIAIHSTSATDDDAKNSNLGSAQWAQAASSRQSWNRFFRELWQSDVVFYSGHSRLGAGLGFQIQSFGQDAYNYLFHPSFGPMRKALSAEPSRLKLLGIMACQSEKYYRPLVEEANPRIDMLLSNVDLEAEDGEQIQIGAINALLAKSCRPEFQKSLIPEGDPRHRQVKYVRRKNKAQNVAPVAARPAASLPAPEEPAPPGAALPAN
jgi:hypothetical protein